MAHLKSKVYVFFEKSTGKQLFATDSEDIANKSDKNSLLCREFFLYPGEVYDGDYETGKVIDRYNKPIIYESVLRREVEVAKQQRYPLDVMVYMILNVLVKNPSIELTPEFKEMINFLEESNKKLFKKIEILKLQKDNITFIPNDSKA